MSYEHQESLVRRDETVWVEALSSSLIGFLDSCRAVQAAELSHTILLTYPMVDSNCDKAFVLRVIEDLRIFYFCSENQSKAPDMKNEKYLLLPILFLQKSCTPSSTGK